MKFKNQVISLFFVGLLFSCASKKFSNISYLNNTSSQLEAPSLNVFVPRKKAQEKLPVFLFVHGGNWNSGKKEIYGFLGRNMAKHNVVTVIPGYTLSPDANYDDMAEQIASAIEWTKKNISEFKGDPNQIYISGHSAGGHLVALVATNPKYLKDKSIIKGVILNDAAGLDRVNYFKDSPPTSENNYITTWTKNPEKWRDASPIYFIDENTPPFKIYLGTKTYNSITEANNRFINELKQYQPTVNLEMIDKKHIPMVTQFIWPWNNRYDEIVDFINSFK